ncbi:MAG: copper-binding protein [Deltaproteobacteria bacterium]|jgi:Cu/Ag efflux protein CusF|nr:copper-binding protein [Deltaproteobacteria bacterium]
MKSLTQYIVALGVAALLTSPGLALAQGHAGHDGMGHGGAAQAAPRVYSTDAEVVEIDAANSRIVAKHGPIPQVGWEAMTMGFQVGDPGLLEGLKPGDKVTMDISFGEGPGGPTYAVVDLAKTGQ